MIGDETFVDDPGEMPYEASHGISAALARFTLPFQIAAGTRITADLSECDRVNGSVELPVNR